MMRLKSRLYRQYFEGMATLNIRSRHQPGRGWSRFGLTAGLLGVLLGDVALGQTPPELLLGRPTDQSITLAVRADAGEVYVEYGATSGELTQSTERVMIEAEPLKIVLENLEPNTRYHYRVLHRPEEGDDFLPGAEFSFMTQRARGEEFTFTITSDSHQGYQFFYDEELYYITLGNIRADAPDFHVDLGDAISLDGFVENEATVAVKYLEQRRAFAEIGHSSSVFLVLGNHENEEGWNLDDTGDFATSLPVLGANARKKYFVNPVPDDFYTGNLDDSIEEISGDHLKEDYYAFEWGDALFVALDPFWYTMRKPFAGGIGGERQDEEVGNRWDWTLGLEQYEWLRETLENSDAKYKFVFSHQLAGGTADYSRGGALGSIYCEWGGYDVDGQTWRFDEHRPDMITPIHDLMVANGVDVFFHGHDHVFVTEQRDGLIYQECPHAANDDYGLGFGSNVQDYDGELVANSGHVRVTVGAEATEVEYIRAFLPGDGTNGQVEVAYPVEAKAPNTKPVASDDQAQTFAGEAVLIDVLLNDTDADGDELEVIGVSQPLGGRAVNRFGDVYYEPDPDYCATGEPDRFRYSIRDGRGGSHTALVEVEVLCNRPPVAHDDAVTVSLGQSIEIDVLSNDVDPEEDLDPSSLQLLDEPAAGHAEVSDQGVIEYQAPSDTAGTNTFTYQICDAQGACAQATVTVIVSCEHDAQCETGSACDVARCQDGSCVATPLDCDDGIACTLDQCVAGACEHVPSHDVCASGDICSVGSCEPGADDADSRGCVVAPLVCDDGNPCTADVCNAELGCTTQPQPGSCDDGNPCTAADACLDGACVGAELDCSGLDGECQVGACDPGALGSCVAVAVPDGQTCSFGLCVAGQCISGTPTSDASDAGADGGSVADASSDARVPSEPTGEESTDASAAPGSGDPSSTEEPSGETEGPSGHADSTANPSTVATDASEQTSASAVPASSAEMASSTETASSAPSRVTEEDTTSGEPSTTSGERSTDHSTTTPGSSVASGSDLSTATHGADGGTLGQPGEGLPFDSASGCGCTVGERSGLAHSAYWWLGALAALALRVRRRR